MQNDKFKNYLHLHFIVFIWGFTAVLGALISIEAIPLVWYRMLIASILTLIYVKTKKISLKIKPKSLLVLFAVGLIIALHWLSFFGAIKMANASVTLAIMSTGALFASFLEPLFYRRKIIAYEVLFGLLAVVGLYIIFDVSESYFWGIILALTASFLGALFAVLNGKLVLKHNPALISFYELSFGGLCITAYLFFSNGFSFQFFNLNISDWVYILILASFCTAYAFNASVYIMKWISPYTVMLTTNMEPVYGILLALVILGDSEQMSPQFYYGALLILITVIANGIVKIKRGQKSKRLIKT